jgi:hypothetical protein
VNAQPVDKTSAADILGNFLAVVAIFAGLFALAYRPVRFDTFAIILSFISAGLSRNQRLPAIAVATTAVCFILGMLIAILAEKPLF